MNKKQLEREMMDDYHRNPIGLLLVIVLGFIAMIAFFTYAIVYLIDWII